MVDSTAFESMGVEPAGLLAVVADPVRWRLLAHLADGATRCVCELQPVAAVAPNLLSYHLRVLREAGLVGARRRGRWMDYTITADALDRLRAALPSMPVAGGGERRSSCRPAALSGQRDRGVPAAVRGESG